MSYTNTQAKAQPLFKGWLTNLLHEAFYLEEQTGEQSMQDPMPDEKTFEDEEEVEQFEFLKQFLGVRQLGSH